MQSFSEEQLNKLDKDILVQMIMNLQDQIGSLDQKMQLMLEQMADLKRHRFGVSSEKSNDYEQYAFVEVNGNIIYFNEAEAVVDASVEEADTPAEKKPSQKEKGKKAAMLAALPKADPVFYTLSNEELLNTFGADGYNRLPDEVYTRYKFTPSKLEVEEHHVAVYSGKKDDNIIKAKHPAYLLRGSMVSPSLAAAFLNAKYTNGMPYYRQEKDFERYGISITRKDMAEWTIKLADRYLAILYDYLHDEMYNYHVLQADETPLLVNKDGRDAGSKSYMWVYRTGKMYTYKPIVLYDYQRTRKADHPREFLKNFTGICVTDGYQVYHTIEGEREDLTIAGCWAHARRRYDEALKALPKEKQKGCLAKEALSQIQMMYRIENTFSDLSPEERKKRRQLSLKPLVEAYFAWVRENMPRVLPKSKTYKGFEYSLNQEKYLKEFLNDGEVPMDNNSTEQTIRGFCIGKKNWVMIDTISGAKSSAIVYSIIETAKANNLKPYEYLNHLLTEIPNHMDDTDRSFLKDLLPWSENLPKECYK